ncbi:MAG: hypothetical protein PHI36_10155 [Bacteroidales bacterium]|nr:hypothetical protein [Bacteroidales bacterium]
MNRAKAIFFFFVSIMSFNSLAQEQDSIFIQNIPIKEDSFALNMAFVHHLIRIKEPRLALHEIEKLEQFCDTEYKCDSLSFVKAKLHFSQKNFQPAILAFNNVKPTDSKYNEALFYKSISHSYLSNFTQAENNLQKLNLADTNFLQLYHLNKTGIAMMKNEKKEANIAIQEFNYQWYPVAEQQENLKKLLEDWNHQKKKSMFTAGLLSAIVPGSGKIYAGRLGEGVSAFLMTAGMALVTYENFRKDGWKDPKTIFFGSIFATFYIGNIWGSALSVKLIRDEYNQYVQEQVLINLRIPIRIIYE